MTYGKCDRKQKQSEKEVYHQLQHLFQGIQNPSGATHKTQHSSDNIKL